MARTTYQSRPTKLTAEPFTQAQADGPASDLPRGVYRTEGTVNGQRSHYVITAQKQLVRIAPGEYVADEMYADGCYPIDAGTFHRRWQPVMSSHAG